MQKLFAVNRGTHLISVMENGLPVQGKDSVYASAVIDNKTSEVIIKIVNSSATAINIDLIVDGTRLLRNTAIMQVLTADKNAANSLISPQSVAPKTESIAVKNKTISLLLKPSSFSVIRIATNRKQKHENSWVPTSFFFCLTAICAELVCGM